MANTRSTLGEQATLDGLVARTLTSFEEDGVTTVHSYALYGFSSLTSIKMPNLTSCGDYAFLGVGLTEITTDMFPNLTINGSYGFASCKNLTRAEFSKLKTTGSSGFQNDSNLTFFKLDSLDKPTISPNTFNGCSKLTELVILSNEVASRSNVTAFSSTPIAGKFGTIYVPRSLVDAYKADSSWSSYFIAAWEDYPVLPEGTITDSWAEILEAEANGSYLTKYSIGDTKYTKFGDYIVDFEIAAFDKDDLSDGTGKAHITWIAKHFVYTASMNDTNTSADGWAGCRLRSDLRALLAASGSDLKAAVKEVNKTYYNGTSSSTKTIADTIWIPSIYEVGATGSPNRESSGVAYDDLFTSDTARIKCPQTSNSANYWWLRSAPSDSACFCHVTTTGSTNSRFASNYYGVVPGLCT